MDQTFKLTSQLKRVIHFRDLPEAELESIVLAGQVRKYIRGQTLFVEDEASAGLFVLLSGQVQICRHSQQGVMTIFSVFEPVIMFNEVAALDGNVNPATAIALEDSLVWQIDSEHFWGVVRRFPHLAEALLRVLAARNRRIVAQYQDLSARSVPTRTAKLLVELSKWGKEVIDRRKYPNHQLAARIATVPEAFSRALRVFRESGVIACNERQIDVVDLPGLLEAAQLEMPCHKK
jgi:CRP/FNR family transcriptional regulator